MGFKAFLAKEWYSSRQNIAVLLVVLVLLPGAAAFGTAAFQQTMPEDIPIGVTATDDSVKEEDLTIIEGGTTLYATPERYDSPDDARDALEREEVYLAIEVPPGLFEEDADVNATLVSDNRMASFQEPANYTESQLAWELDQQFPANVNVEHERVGTKLTLSEYLTPTALLVTIMVFAFLFLPFDLHRERRVFERVELTSRIETAVLAKITYAAVLLIIPLTVFQLVGYTFGYRVTHFSPHTFTVLALTFVYAAAVSTAVMFFTRLSRAGLFTNLGIMIGVFALSSFVYPVGFFSELRKDIALQLPTYYSSVMTRSTMLKDTPLSVFSSELAFITGFTVASLITLQLSIMYYRRQT